MSTEGRIRKYFLVIVCSLAALVSFAQEYQYPFSPLRDRDPLRPLVNERGDILISQRKIGGVVLQGIIYSPEGSQAFINNEVFREGDVFDGFRIKRIEPNAVILEKDNEEVVVNWEG